MKCRTNTKREEKTNDREKERERERDREGGANNSVDNSSKKNTTKKGRKLMILPTSEIWNSRCSISVCFGHDDKANCINNLSETGVIEWELLRTRVSRQLGLFLSMIMEIECISGSV